MKHSRAWLCSHFRLPSTICVLLIIPVVVLALLLPAEDSRADREDWCASNVALIRFKPDVISFPSNIDYGHNSFVLPLEHARFTLSTLSTALVNLGQSQS